jgi:type II secretory pathway pseudopilin PulG
MMLVLLLIGVSASMVLLAFPSARTHAGADADQQQDQHHFQEGETALRHYFFPRVQLPMCYIRRLPQDPWGNEYQLLSPGQHGAIDVFSVGPEGPVADVVIGVGHPVRADAEDVDGAMLTGA